MNFFDASVLIGKSLTKYEVVNHERFIVLDHVDQADDAASLISYMDYAGIDKAVVGHRTMMDWDPIAGNQILLESIHGYEDRLIPSLTILPDITDEQFSPKVLFDFMKKHNVKILRAYPEINRYFLNAVTMGEQLGCLSDLKIPLYLENRNGFEGIYAVLNEFPDLTIIISNIGCWCCARFIYPLLRRYKNVYFETGDLTKNRGLEDLCLRYGSEHALFGTNFPTNNMGCGMSVLMGAKISEEHRENIAFKNMERLIKEVKL